MCLTHPLRAYPPLQVPPAHIAGFLVRSLNTRRESAREPPPPISCLRFHTSSRLPDPPISSLLITASMMSQSSQGQLAFRFYMAALGATRDDAKDAAAGVDAARVRMRASEEEKELAARAQQALNSALRHNGAQHTAAVAQHLSSASVAPPPGPGGAARCDQKVRSSFVSLRFLQGPLGGGTSLPRDDSRRRWRSSGCGRKLQNISVRSLLIESGECCSWFQPCCFGV